MKKTWFLLLLLASMSSGATEISVGGVSVTIPDPEGFSPVTPEMAALFEIQKNFVPPTNEEFIAFIPDRDVPAALKDEPFDLPRRFTVQTGKDLVGMSVSTADFERLKGIVKTQNMELLRQVEAKLPGLTKRINEGMAEKYDMDLALSVSQVVPMPVHEETDSTLAYSMLIKYDMNDESGRPAPFIAVATTTFAHVKGKVLFLYSYAEESGLEWSKEASRKWATSVVSSNPSDGGASMNEDVPAPASVFDWVAIGEKALVGAIIGGIIGLIGLLRKGGRPG